MTENFGNCHENLTNILQASWCVLTFKRHYLLRDNVDRDMRTYSCAHTDEHWNVNTHIHTYTHMHTHIYTYTYVRTYVCILHLQGTLFETKASKWEWVKISVLMASPKIAIFIKTVDRPVRMGRYEEGAGVWLHPRCNPWLDKLIQNRIIF